MSDEKYIEKALVLKGIEMWKEKAKLFLKDTLESKILKCLLKRPMTRTELEDDLKTDSEKMETSLSVLIEHGLVKGTGPYSNTSVGEAFALYSPEDLEALQEAIFNAAKELNEST